MGGANRLNRPRRGSLQVWPRVRAQRHYPSVRTFVRRDANKLLGFMGYKAGMTHVLLKNTDPHSPLKNQTVSVPVTILDCPPLKPVALRFYDRVDGALTLRAEVFADKLEKGIPSHKKHAIPERFDEVRLLVHTQPKLTSLGKKDPDLIEFLVGGKTREESLALAKELLKKDIKCSEVFQEGQLLDVHAVTKGKGFQGTVKRFGVPIRQHKSEKTKRGIGTLGPWTPKRVSVRVAQPGRMGYHSRTEYNKLIVKIVQKPEEINQKGGITHYGLVRNEVLLVKGSVPGAKKRPIVLTEPRRGFKPHQSEFLSVSTESKQ